MKLKERWTSDTSICDTSLKTWYCISCSPRIPLYLIYVYMNMQVQIFVLWINGAVTVNSVLGMELNILTSLYVWNKGLLRFNVTNKSHLQWDMVSNISLLRTAFTPPFCYKNTQSCPQRDARCYWVEGWVTDSEDKLPLLKKSAHRHYVALSLRRTSAGKTSLQCNFCVFGCYPSSSF
jgi:hypothetical protein